jgi:hypothetical protein
VWVLRAIKILCSLDPHRGSCSFFCYYLAEGPAEPHLQGASILTGLGFTGYSPSGTSLWDGASNVRIREIETPSNFKVLIDSWNMKTNVWLRECVYKRVTPKGKKPGFSSSMITFGTSALWVGPLFLIVPLPLPLTQSLAWSRARILHDFLPRWIHNNGRSSRTVKHPPAPPARAGILPFCREENIRLPRGVLVTHHHELHYCSLHVVGR